MRVRRPALHPRRAVAAGSVLTALALAVTTVPATAAPAPQARGTAACDPFGTPEVDGRVPTAESVLGFPLGTRDVTTAESDAYLQAVADASPLVTEGVLGESVQGRPLRYAVVGQRRWTSPAGLERVADALAEIRDPATRPRRAEVLLRRTPAVLWVAGNVHGGEESGTDAALRVLYELAAREDCAAAEILDDAIVVVLPTQNPDGREADTRRNAYGFDMNRDWFARTQPETDAKIELMRQLRPQLFIDAHEMGAETYFFPPNADPVYHEIGEQPLEWIYGLYGPAMQDAFARFGYDYFNGDIYDLFYMGYGDTVPSTGLTAAGMTFEKNNAEPTDVRVQEQYVAIWASLAAAGGRDRELLREWRAEHVTAYEQGLAGTLEPNQLYYEGEAVTNPVPDIRIRNYFLRSDDPATADEVQRLVRRLQRMDVEVRQLTEPLRVRDYTPYGRPTADTTLPAGTYWVPTAQAQKHWVHAMLHEDTYVPFPYFYDVTAWSGPLLGNIDGGRSGDPVRPRWRPVRRVAEPPAAPLAAAPAVGVWQVSATSAASIESAGWLRWHFDNRLGLDFTDVSAEAIAAGGLAGLDALVVPNGSAAAAATALGPAGQAALAEWVRGGGTLVTFRTAGRLAADLGLTTATYVPASDDLLIPGSLVRTEVDTASPLAADVGPTVWTMVEFDDVWTATTPGTAAASYPVAGDPDWFVSGFADGEEELYGTASVVDEAAGAGRVVVFASDPNFRAFTDGTATLLRNVLERAGAAGPAAAVPADPGTPAETPVETPAANAAAAGPAPAVDVPADALVVAVSPDAEAPVEEALAGHGGRAVVSRGEDAVTFYVDLGGLTADEHPWARAFADDVAGLGDGVRLVRLP